MEKPSRHPQDIVGETSPVIICTNRRRAVQVGIRAKVARWLESLSKWLTKKVVDKNNPEVEGLMEDKEALMLTAVSVGEEGSPASKNKTTACTLVYSHWDATDRQDVGSHGVYVHVN